MKTQEKHEQSGCVDYLQHSWQSCPQNQTEQRDTAQRNQSGAQYTGSPSGLPEFHKWASEHESRTLEGWLSEHPTSGKSVHVVTKNGYDKLWAHAELLAEALGYLTKRCKVYLDQSPTHDGLLNCEAVKKAREALNDWSNAQ